MAYHHTSNDHHIAIRKGGTLRYTHTDHLGSSSGQTDTSGNAIVDSYLRYYAYGTLRSGDPTQSTTDRTYTGQKQDGTGLLYYNARYYDSALGVFLSPDTLVPDAGRVVDYNRFLYVRGNPLKYNDPSGHASCAAGAHACWQQEWDYKNRWYKAHGYSWDSSASHWSSASTPEFSDFGILQATLGDAGIQFVSGWDWSTQKAQMSAIGQAVVQFGSKLASGLAGLKNLLGGGAGLYHLAQTPWFCAGAPACALPTFARNVYYSTSELAGSSERIGLTTVHELAHLVDWQSTKVGGISFSTTWEKEFPTGLTKYANCTRCVRTWERWAEAVTYWVWGRGTRDSVDLDADQEKAQMRRMNELLNGGH